MIKILHSADWHLDAPMSGHSEQQAEFLRRELRKVPEKIAKLARAQSCDLMVLSGDLFDGSASQDTVRNVQNLLAEVGMPVFISPGNHDFLSPESPYLQEGWSENVHIFREPKMTDVALPELDLRIWGAGYTSMDCPGLLQDFQAVGPESFQIGVIHGEAEVSNSSYCPITKDQIAKSGLQYLALGHIHKGSSLRAGSTLCAWPGCPMGRGYDELGAKGVVIVSLEDEVSATFLPLDTPRFFDEDVEVGVNPKEAIAALLPALETEDFYRLTLVGYASDIQLSQLTDAFPHVPNLILRDETLPEMDLWGVAGEDSLEGVLFELLHEATESESEELQSRATLAARICRQILDGQEVKLP